MNNVKKQGIIIAIIWSTYVTLLLMMYSDALNMMSSGGIGLSLIIYLIYNPAYMILIYSTHRLTKRFGKKAWKRAIGSISLILALDIVAMPRTLLNEATTGSQAGNFGGMIVNNLSNVLPHSVAFIVTYIVLPIALLITAAELFGLANFIRDVKNGHI